MRASNTPRNVLGWICGIAFLLSARSANTQDVLPFPTPPMGGKVGATMQESVHKWRTQPSVFRKTPRTS